MVNVELLFGRYWLAPMLRLRVEPSIVFRYFSTPSDWMMSVCELTPVSSATVHATVNGVAVMVPEGLLMLMFGYFATVKVT